MLYTQTSFHPKESELMKKGLTHVIKKTLYILKQKKHEKQKVTQKRED
jgi:hypothetical protein